MKKGLFSLFLLAAALAARGEDHVFPAVAASGWTAAPAMRVDNRDTLGGRIVHGVEMLGEPDGTTNRLWDTTEIEDGWHEITAENGALTASILAVNASSIAIEGGRLATDAAWTSNATHVVRHWVVVPSGRTLVLATNSVTKLCPGAGIKVEDGGMLRFVGAEGAEAVVTTCDDDTVGAVLPDGSPGGLAPPYGLVGGVVKQSSSATVSDDTHVRIAFSSGLFPTVSVQDASAKRSDGVARIPVTVSGTARDTAFRADWRAVDGSAKFGEDYLLASGTLRWSKSSDGTKHIEIPLDTDTIRGSNTAFRVELTSHYACNISRASADVVVREFDFPEIANSGWSGSAAIRFDGREGIAGAVVHGIERLGEPDGSTNRLWDTTQWADGWQEIESCAGSETNRILLLNAPEIAVEGGRLSSSAVWTSNVTHLVRHMVVVPSGKTLTIAEGAVVKFLPGTFIKVEDGGTLSVLGAAGDDAIFTSVADDRFGAAIDCGEFLDFEVHPTNGIGGIVAQSDSATFQDNSHLQIHSFCIGSYPTVKLNDTVAFRDGGMAYVPVSIASGTRNQAFSIDWEAVDGTATFGDDYTLASGTIEWTGTSQGTKTLQIPIVTSHVVGETTSFKLRIKVCRGCNPQGAGECTVAIRELDTIHFSVCEATSAPIRFDSRESLGGRIVHGTELRGEPDGSAATAWNTGALGDGWHEIVAGGETAELLSINAPEIAVEGGRLVADTTWDDSTTHLVRHWVVVPSGRTLTVTEGTVVKICPNAGIRVEDGGNLVVNGRDGADAIFTRIDDSAESEQSSGEEEVGGDPSASLLAHYTFTRTNLLEAKVGSNARESCGSGTVSYSETDRNIVRVEDDDILGGRPGAVSVPAGTGFSVPVPPDADGANWAFAMDFYLPGQAGEWKTFFSLSQANNSDGALFVRQNGQVGQENYQTFSGLFGAWHQLAVSTANGTSRYWIDGIQGSWSKNWALTPGGWLHVAFDNNGEDGEMLLGQFRLYGKATPAGLFPDGGTPVVLAPDPDDGTPVVAIASLKSSVSKGTRLAVRLADAGGKVCRLRALVAGSDGMSRTVLLSSAATPGLYEYDLASLLELIPGTVCSVIVEAENVSSGRTARALPRSVLVPKPLAGIDWTNLDAGTPGGIVVLSGGTFQDNGWFQMRGVSCNASNIGQLSIHGAEVSRKAGVAYVAVTVSGNTRNQSFSADWEAMPGTATLGRDYTLASGRVTWSKSGDGTKWIAVPLNKKTETDERRTFTVRLKTVRGMDGTGGEATVEIREYEEGALGGGEVAFFPEGEGSAPFAIDEPIWKEPMFRHETEPIRISGAWQNVADPAQTLVRLSWESESDAGMLAEAPGGEPTTYTWRAEDWPVGSYTLRHDILDAESGRRLASYLKTFAVPTWENVEMHGGTLTSNETWRAGAVHVVYETVRVPALYTILLEPGAIVKFLTGTGITIEAGGGALFANGVVFTHINDDTVGGDTLNDGATLAPVMDAYTFSGDFTIGDESELRCKTQASLSGTISGSRKLSRGSTYRVSGNVSIASGGTLTIPAGTILKFDPGVQMTVNSGGTLLSNGTRAAPVVFTSIKDDEFGGDTNGDGDTTGPSAGDWATIRVAGGRAEFHNSKILYSSRNQTTGAINQSGGTVVFDGGEIAHGLYDAVGVESGSFFMTNAVIRDCLLAFRHWARDPIVNCVIHDCGRLTQGGGQTFVNCVFADIDEAWEAFGFPKSTYRNCVFWNEGGSVLTGEGTQDAMTVCGRDGNVWGNPMFRDAEAGDYRIREGSVCIDAADSSAAPDKDMFGQKRWDFPSIANADAGAADIGVAECVPRDAASDVDLVPVSVRMSWNRESVKPGDAPYFFWSVANEGGEDVVTDWWDELSLVSVASGRITVLGEYNQGKGVSAGGTTTGSQYFEIPPLTPGDYRLRLNANSHRSDVPEGSRTDNNVLVAETVVHVEVATEDAANGSSGMVQAGGRIVRAFEMAPGAGTMLVRVTAPAGAVVRYGLGVMPGEGTASGEIVVDASGQAIFAVPEGSESVYVVLESAEDGLYDIMFLDGALAVASVSPSQVPRSGTVTLRVAGAGFAEGCAVSLVAPSGAAVTPVSLLRASAEDLWATVDCAVLAAAGTRFALRVETDAGDATLENAVTVTGAEGRGSLWAELDHSNLETTRRGARITARIRYGNHGNADIPAPILQVAADGGGELGYIDGHRGYSAIHFVGAGGSAVAGILRPGEERIVQFHFWAGESSSIYLYTSERQTWFEAPWPDMDAMLVDFSAAATRIALRGQDATDYALVRDLALAVKNGEATSAIYGRVVDQDGVGVEGVIVSFADTNMVAAASAATDATGRFVSTMFEPGEYAIQFLAGIAVDWPESVFADRLTDIDLGVVIVSNALSGIARFTGTIPAGTVVWVSSLESGMVAQAQWADETTAVFRGLPDGWYHVEATGENAAAEGVLRVGGDAVSEIELEMLPIGTISGIIAELADPLELGIMVVGRNGSVRVAYADETGAFSVSGLPPGAYSVQVVGNGADSYEATDEFELLPGGSEYVLFEPSQSQPTNVHMQTRPTSAASPRSSDYVPGSNLWFWHYWGTRDDLKEAIERGRAALNSTGVYDPWTCECEHNRAKYASDTTVYNNLERIVIRMEALEARADRGYFAPIWKYGLEAVGNTIRAAKEIQIMFRSGLDAKTKDELMGNVGIAGSVAEYFEEVGGKDSDFAMETARFIKSQLIPDMEKISTSYEKLCSAGIGGALSAVGASMNAGRLDPLIDYMDTVTDLYDEIRKVVGLAKKGASFRQYLKPEYATELAVIRAMADSYETAANNIQPIITYLKAVADLLRTEQAWEDGYAGWMDDRRRMEMALARFEPTYVEFKRKSVSFNAYHNPCPGDDDDIPPFEDEVDSVTPSIPQSIDPNEVVGPYGLGDPETERFVKPGEWLDFTIYFENATNATASAREVNIREDLSPYLDWDSIQLGEVVFANETDMGLAGTGGGTSEYAVPGTNYLVRTTFIQRNGLANWYLRLVDPEGDEDGWPFDEWLYTYGGFLPPNTTNHVGEGHVSYRIKVRDDAPKNVRIVTSAAITFDSHETIPTDPSWWNTVGHLPVALAFDRNCDDVVLDMPTNGSYKCDAPGFGTPSREGWLFLGWADTNGVARNCGADLPYDTAALDLYAQWREEVETKFATIAVDGGVLIAGLADGQSCPSDLVIPATVEVGGRRVKVIGVADDAFKGKRAIQTLTVMEGVRSIGARSFMNCTSLASVSLPSTIESIGENAFYGCRLLSAVSIAAETPPALGSGAFRSVASAGALAVPEGSEAAYGEWIGTDLGAAWTIEGFNPGEPEEPGEPEWTVLPDQNLLLYAAGPSDVRWAIEVDIDAAGGLTLVQATGSAEPGEDFVLPDSVLDSDGNEYRIVAIGANADILDAGIFEGQEFVSVTIPKSVETIAPCAFANCAGLREVVFVGDEPALRELGEGAFFSCTSLSVLDLAPLSSLERIGPEDAILGVFESCWYLPEVTLPATVETIGAYAFQDCSRLRAVRAGGGDAALTAIGERAFYNCDSLESIEAGCLAALETMGDAAFGGDTAASAPKIARITLGVGTVSLGADVFLNAAQLAEVTCLATNPPAHDANAFRGMLRTGILRLPEEAVEDYTNETARAWVGTGAGKLSPWNGSTGWQVKSGDAGGLLREMESHLTDEEFEAFLALATLLGFTEEELCEVDHPAEQLAPELRIVSFDPDAEYQLAIRFENGIDETPAAAFARLWSASGDKIFAAVSDELGGVERRVPLLGIQGDDGFFRVNLGTAFHRDEPAQFVRIIIQ